MYIVLNTGLRSQKILATGELSGIIHIGNRIIFRYYDRRLCPEFMAFQSATDAQNSHYWILDHYRQEQLGGYRRMLFPTTA